MAVSLDNPGGGGGRGRARWKPKAEINVTPFVDVMLVLLIVFMVTAPLLTPGVLVDLPDTEARVMTQDEEPLTITVGADGVILLMETPVELEELGPRLTAIAGAGYESRVIVYGDEQATHGRMTQVYAQLQAAGFYNLGVVTEPPN